ncbi:hypothetical protein EF834_17125 [Rhodococcus spongiicola]|uniref:ESX-1 secretion-associated protein n=2 Tax=Rhodococcus spongiicola TaxID=2487352 RepID=A0A3S3AHA4_9NOCA|nr:hypothetical protein EF834_17125 [Rhodococcus spongiicola]
MLRRFATAITDVADTIIGTDVSTPFADSEAALPGTEFAKVCVAGLEATGAALGNLHSRLTEISEIAHGTAGEYEVSEADFTGMLHAMNVPA